MQQLHSINFFAECRLLESKINADERGSFERLYCDSELINILEGRPIKQISISRNPHAGTFRGLHYNKIDTPVYKIVSCIKGKVWDIILDIRPESPTYQMWKSIELEEKDNKSLLIPPGFAHGFQTLKKNSNLLYFHTESYKPSSEMGISIFDLSINIQLPLEITKISTKDREA